MSNITRAEILKLAESQTDDFIKLVSDLIRIPSENPTGTQREVVDYLKRTCGRGSCRRQRTVGL